MIVTEYLDPPGPFRVPAVLEALRVAALSTYENRRVSIGALLLGTRSRPGRARLGQPGGGPTFNARLTAIKGFHRLCDGVRTVFLVDRQGDLVRPSTSTAGPTGPGERAAGHPCPRPTATTPGRPGRAGTSAWC